MTAAGRGPRVSVVIPTYRHQDFILATLHSVFAQTMTEYEVIVINDGSPDDTAAILEPLVRDGRIVYVEQTNKGQSRARNLGIERARGDYIALLDDDDLWPPDKLEWQTEYLDAHRDVGLIGGMLQTIDENGTEGWKGKYWPSIDFESLFLENPFLSPGQTLIRADLLKRIGGMDSTIWGADDWDLWFRIAKASRIVMLDRLALYYRLHPGNASKQTERLLSACCVTIERHLPDVPRARRAALRFGFQRTVYEGLGAVLTRKARSQARDGDVIGAVKTLKGLLPLWRGLALNTPIRSSFLRHAWWGSE
jgi:glycosyltransferase involved in cell wall biosynthesis